MNGLTAHRDTFVRDRLPPPDLWPDLINLDQLNYPERLNCVVELLDNAVTEGYGERVCVRAPNLSWSYAELQTQVNRIAQVLTEDHRRCRRHRHPAGNAHRSAGCRAGPNGCCCVRPTTP